MSELKVTGVIQKILPTESGVSKAGKEFKKCNFILTTSEQYNNLYAFELFGGDKVDNLLKFNKEGDTVEVNFNVNCREHQGKYYTSLSAWSIKKATVEPAQEWQHPVAVTPTQEGDLPF